MEFIEDFEIVYFLIDKVIGIRPYFLGADVFKNGFGLLGIIPEIGLL